MTYKWDAGEAIRRMPNNYEYVGLGAEESLARIRWLVDVTEERKGPGYLVEHVKELATCLSCWSSASQVAEAA